MESSTYYTLEDYYMLGEFGEKKYIKWELIKGIFKMSPAPKTNHQKSSAALLFEVYGFFKKKKCKVFDSPYDIILGDSVVQPDICVICDTDKIKEHGCVGIPDFIIEILSKSTEKMDRIDKFNLYEEFGLKEYWIVDPLKESNITLTQFVSEDNILTRKQQYTKSDKIRSYIFPDLEICLEDILITREGL